MLFGATRLADLGGSMGKGIKEFRKAVKDDEDEPTTPVASTNGASTSQETVAAVKCASCGALNAVGSKHCNQCGAAIAAPVT
jgi:Sec-independent protein translocase protein TatA